MTPALCGSIGPAPGVFLSGVPSLISFNILLGGVPADTFETVIIRAIIIEDGTRETTVCKLFTNPF